MVLSHGHTIFLDMNHGTPTGDPSYYLDQSYEPKILLPKPARKAYDKAILVGGDTNYYHWVVDFLPRLMALGRTPALDDHPILIHETLLPYQREGLALAGIPEERVITLGYPACYPCRELIMPLFPSDTPEMQDMRSRRSAIAWLRQLVSPFTGKGRKIYISRLDSKRRTIIREDVLIALLEKEGFEIVALAGLSQKEQIGMFSQAEIIISGHGAGLGNIAFAPENCRIIEIANPNWHNKQFETLAAIRHQRYFSASCRTYFAEPISPIFHDYYLTDQAIEEILDITHHP
jgi:capsular polysaccharide biosynthesis protein